MSFSAQFGGAKVSQTLNITSSGPSVNFFATSNTTNPNWLTVNPQTGTILGTAPSAVTVTADPTGLQPGTYGAQIQIFVGATASLTVPVSLTVSSIGASPQSLQFTTVLGSTPASQTLVLSGQTTSFSAVAATSTGGTWLAVNPPSGNAPTTIFVSLNNAVVPFLAAGTYNGSITITPANSPPLTVLVTLTVTPTPPVAVTPTSLNLGFQIGGTNNAASQVLTVSTTATLPLSFTVAPGTCPNPSGSPWVTISPTSVSAATGSAPVTIGYNTAANLPASATPYNCNVAISAPGFTPSTVNVNVSLLVSTSPLLIVPNAPLNFTYELSGAVPPAQSVTPTATSGTIPLGITVTYGTPSVNWIVVTPPTTGAVTGSPFSVAVNPAGLAPGTYTGTITVTGSGTGNGPQQIPVNLIVANDPLIVANGCTAASAACSLSFAYQTGQAAPGSQSITLSSSTGASLNYTATAATTSCGTWLGLNGAAGVTNGTVTVSVLNPTALTAATCTGTITIAATNPSTNVAAPNSPLVIPVTLFVSNNALLLVSQTPVAFAVPVNGQASQVVNLTSTNAASPLSYTVAFTTATGGPWLSVNQLSGTTASNNSLLITAFPGANLSAGTYTGSVTVTATGPAGAAVANSPVTIPVTLTVTSGALSLGTSTLSFTQLAGGTAPGAQTVQVSSTGQALNYTAVAATKDGAAWLSVTPSGGTTNSSLSVTVDGSKLTPGLYSGTVTVTAFGSGGSPISGSPASVQVTLAVTAGTISAAPTALTFTQATGGSSAPQTINVTASGATAPIAFTVTAAAAGGGTWLTATPASGNTPGAVQVSANAGNLAVGQYTGTVTITAPTASGSPISIPVTLNVVTPQTITATPATLAFAFTIGSSAPPVAQSVQVATTGSSIPLTMTAATKDGANWLSVTPTTANTPAALSVAVNPLILAAGTYTGTVSISSPNATTATVAVTLTVVTVPTPVVSAIINAASGSTGGLSPGENITIFGSGLGPATLAGGQVSGGVVTTVTGNTRVLFDGVAAPVIYASAVQTSVMVPYGVAGRTSTSVQVEYLGVPSAPTSFNVVTSAPGIYSLNLSGTGPGATLNQDGRTVNGPATPAPKGSVVTVYMTGEGQTSPIGTNGTVTPADGTGLKKPNLAVTATVGGIVAPVLYAGSAPGIVSGVMQVNLQIPATAPSGATIALAIAVGGTNTQAGITIAVQ
ncbi:MAG TPA: IPT/TIG domain-containing protein [Candidatus Acidoferrales bacterium]|nr:IPT/TIG domain-containing protein [Candidatus Acidoferrales bacterium]